MRRWLAMAGVLLAGCTLAGYTLAACTLAVDLEPLENGECMSGFKVCDELCRPLNSPMYGCAAANCNPCALANAVSVCSARGECAIASCANNFEDCDDLAQNGCERNLGFDPMHCGMCNRVCRVPNAEPACSLGTCAIRVCDPGFANCNTSVVDGCETRVVDNPMRCGDCETRCEDGQSCVDGLCV